ncbi:hypothetical protein P7C70_g8855, partial [Phenoliferia sp. Uapishka_3]
MIAPPVTINSLPPELLDHILDLVHGPSAHLNVDENDYLGNSDLLAASLVCQGWRESAQRRLCQDARIVLVFNDLCIMDPPTLLHPSRHLRLNMDRLMERLSFEGWWHRIVTDWMTTFGLQNPGLRTLHLTGKAQTYFNWVDFSLPSLAGLTHLEISMPDRLFLANMEGPISFQLRHLGLWLRSDPPAEGLVKALFTASRQTLRSLELCLYDNLEPGSPTYLSEDLPLVAPQLDKLSIDLRDSRSGPQVLVDLQKFVALQTFELVLSPHRPVEEGSALFINPYLDQLPSPSTLKTLTVGVADAARLFDLPTIFSHPSLSQLRRLVLPLLNDRDFKNIDGWQNFIEECERREVRVLYREELLESLKRSKVRVKEKREREEREKEVGALRERVDRLREEAEGLKIGLGGAGGGGGGREEEERRMRRIESVRKESERLDEDIREREEKEKERERVVRENVERAKAAISGRLEEGKKKVVVVDGIAQGSSKDLGWMMGDPLDPFASTAPRAVGAQTASAKGKGRALHPVNGAVRPSLILLLSLYVQASNPRLKKSRALTRFPSRLPPPPLP